MSQRHDPSGALIMFGACNTNSCNVLSLQHVARSPTSWNPCNMSRDKTAPKSSLLHVHSVWTTYDFVAATCSCNMSLRHVATCAETLKELWHNFTRFWKAKNLNLCPRKPKNTSPFFINRCYTKWLTLLTSFVNSGLLEWKCIATWKIEE